MSAAKLFAATGWLFLAAALQFHQLGRLDLRFHPDEAYFMTFARGAAVNGDWLLPGALDKPPLTIYASAISMVATGLAADQAGVLHLDPLRGEFSARLPNVMLAIMLTALMMRLAHAACRSETAALTAGLLTALSPFMLAFGATAFTDMGLLFFATLALLYIVCQRFGAAGIALGLAFCCKQQALLFLPLLCLLLLCQGADRAALMRRALRLTLPLSLMVLLLLLWDAVRPETSIFLLGAVNNLPAQWLAPPADWLPRLLDWARLGAWLLGPPLVTAALLGLTALGRIYGSSASSAQNYARACLLYVAAYLVLHSVLAFNQYDRYLLLVLPPLTLLVAGNLPPLLARVHWWKRLSLPLAIALVIFAVWSLRGGLPIGGDRGRYAGIDDLARLINSKPVATVIYDPWLGWQLAYYLGPWSDKRRVHYPTADALAAGAMALDELGDRYLVAPGDRPHEHWARTLAAAGFALAVDYEQDRFILYRVSPVP